MNFASQYVLASAKTAAQADEADTNVVSAKFDSLVERCNAYTGDPFSCANCQVFFSKLSKLSDTTDTSGKRKWICEFCSFENKIKISDFEIPQEQDITYVLEAGEIHGAGDTGSNTSSSTSNLVDSPYLIYCK